MPTTLNKTRTTPPATVPAPLNNKGRPCTSVGQRNAASIGSGLGNGGVTPPGTYERRRDSVTHEIRHHRRFREQWRRVLDHLLSTGDIHRTVHAVGSALSMFSNDTAKNVWPAQATIGDRVGVSESTVCRALAVLREMGMLEYDHQFKQVDGKPRATSNLYEFRIPDALGNAVGVTQRTRRLNAHQIPTPAMVVPDWHRDIDARVHALVLVHTADHYGTAEAELLDDLDGRPAEQLSFAAAALNELWRTRHPAQHLE